MYFWLCFAVFLVWLWLVGGSVFAWLENQLNGWLSFGSIAVWTGVAAVVLLFAGPYWMVIYQVLIQP